MADDWRAEASLLISVKDAVECRLTGRDEPEVLDGEPARRFSVGILNASRKSDKADGSPVRRPESIGFYVRLDKEHLPAEFACRVGFSMYYRVRPTFVQQKSRMAGDIPDDEEIPVVPKYRRIDRIVEGTIRLPRTWSDRQDLDVSGIDSGLDHSIVEIRAAIAQDSEAFPQQGFKLRGAHLRSEGAYVAAFDGAARKDLPTWHLRLHGEIVDFQSHFRLLVLLTNESDPSDFGVGWHLAEVFDASLRLDGTPGCFSPESFSPVRNDYRYQTMTWGKGVNAVLAADNDTGTARTEHLPIYTQPRVRSRSGLEHETATTGLGSDQALSLLDGVRQWLRSYADRWLNEISTGGFSPEVADQMRSDLGRYRSEVDRFELGLSVLREDSSLLRAFGLMNEAFRRSGLSNWRLFQIVFIVSMLPALHAREHRDAPFGTAELNAVDVLWFPTGGGKTEAFLGVIISALFYDRLRGKGHGVSAWLRYPLRMLSIQQLQRLVDIIFHSERVRLEQDDLSASGDPFSVGYYVGEQNAPNDLTFAGKGDDAIDKLHAESLNDPMGLIRYRVLSYCPECRSEEIKVEVDLDAIRIHHVCAKCGFRPPVLISDSEIYRYLPAVLVGTVDRLARAGQTDLFSMIFRGPTGSCSRHGYAAFGTCVESKRCKERIQSMVPLADPCPALLMQDEVHLLRESLGTYDAHYEGFLDLLAREFGNGLPPKRMAATATIEGLEQHIYQLYVRAGRAFPVKGIALNDSAYVEEDADGATARQYIGVLPSGRDADDVSRTIAEKLSLLAASRFREESDDPDYDLLLVYVNEKNTAGDIRAYWPDEVSVQVLTGDKTLEEVRRVLSQAQSDGERSFPDRLHAVIATSVISHGVDLERLNQMVLVGMPRSVAEYVQASSRTGRSHVGSIFTVFRWRNRRDVSMFEHFHETHERLYQMVQPVPVNRVSAASIERTATGLLASVVYNLFGPRLFDAKRVRFQAAKEVMKALENKDLLESEIIEKISSAYFLGYDMMDTYRAAVEDQLERVIKRQLRQLPTKPDWSFHRRLDPRPVSSLREVGEQIPFGMSPKDGKIAKVLRSPRRS